MCITSKRPLKAKTAKKDITVYKLFRVIYDENNPKNVIMTGLYYNNVTYLLGNLHVMPREEIFNCILTLPILAKVIFPGSIVYHTANGLYSFESMTQVEDFFENFSDETFFKNIQYKAYKCIIPKDTMYIKNNREYVSTHLYVTSEEIQLN